MIPNNQFWFGSNLKFNSNNDYIYKAMLLDEASYPMSARDGAGLVYYNGRLILLGGWNPNIFTPNDSCNEQWESYDDGKTWTQLADAPWTDRHTFGYGLKDGKIWVWGGDLTTGSYQKDVWTFDDVNGWVEVTSDWGGPDDRIMFSFAIHKNYLYLIGGQVDNFGTPYTDVWRSLDGVTWTSVGNIPFTNFSTGTATSDGSSLYIMGGGLFINNYLVSTSSMNTDVYKSVDDGANWALVGVLPTYIAVDGNPYNKGGFQNATYFDKKVWFLNGGDPNNNNAYGLWYSDDGCATFTQLYDRPILRHASGIFSTASKMYITTGNLQNDSYIIYPVAKKVEIPTGMAAAYSVRKINSYNGYCMKVRRSSDDTELDIGFDINGDLDTASLLTFVGAGDGFVSCWYDQSGNGYDVVQATTASQPSIVSSGVVITLNGKPSIYSSDGTQVLKMASGAINLGKEYAILGVLKFNSNNREFLGYDQNGGGYAIYQEATRYYHAATSPTGVTCYGNTLGSLGTTSQKLLSIFRDNRILQTYRNGDVIVSSDLISGGSMYLNGSPSNLNGDFYFNNISGENSATYRIIGYYQEALLYSSSQLSNKYAMEADINNYYNIY